MLSAKQYIVLGPQGSGKGTQAKLLAEILGVPHISTGDMFRDQARRATPLGLQAQALMNQGILVPDQVTNAMVKERLREPDVSQGFVLDGYPRNMNQAEFLYELAPGACALELTLNDDEAVRRIAGRRVCGACGANYHLEFAPPRAAVCDSCGGTLIQRPDDTESAVRARLATYHEATEPLLEYYRERNALVSVDGAPPIPEVSKSVRAALEL